MNIDLASQINFADAQGLRDFFLVHQFVHDEEAAALTAQFGVPATTFGVLSPAAEEAWVQLMAAGSPRQPAPLALQDWLRLHAQIHINTYAQLGQNPTTAPDLSLVDFSSPNEFYDWMYVHQQMHDFEQSTLGVS